MQLVSVEIDPREFLDEKSVACAIMADALERIEDGFPEKAATILAEALGRKLRPRVRDAEEERRQVMLRLFREWCAIPAAGRKEFWEWSHGKRHCA